MSAVVWPLRATALTSAPLRHQIQDHLVVAARGGVMQRRVAVVVARVDVGAELLDEILHRRHPAVRARDDGRCRRSLRRTRRRRRRGSANAPGPPGGIGGAVVPLLAVGVGASAPSAPPAPARRRPAAPPPRRTGCRRRDRRDVRDRRRTRRAASSPRRRSRRRRARTPSNPTVSARPQLRLPQPL